MKWHIQVAIYSKQGNYGEFKWDMWAEKIYQGINDMEGLFLRISECMILWDKK